MDAAIRADQLTMVSAFAQTLQERDCRRGFLLYCMEVAMGFKKMYIDIIGRQPDGLSAPKLTELLRYAMSTLTEKDAKDYASGAKMHDDVREFFDEINKSLSGVPAEVVRLNAEIASRDARIAVLTDLNAKTTKNSKDVFLAEVDNLKLQLKAASDEVGRLNAKLAAAEAANKALVDAANLEVKVSSLDLYIRTVVHGLSEAETGMMDQVAKSLQAITDGGVVIADTDPILQASKLFITKHASVSADTVAASTKTLTDSLLERDNELEKRADIIRKNAIEIIALKEDLEKAKNFKFSDKMIDSLAELKKKCKEITSDDFASYVKIADMRAWVNSDSAATPPGAIPEGTHDDLAFKLKEMYNLLIDFHVCVKLSSVVRVMVKKPTIVIADIQTIAVFGDTHIESLYVKDQFQKGFIAIIGCRDATQLGGVIQRYSDCVGAVNTNCASMLKLVKFVGMVSMMPHINNNDGFTHTYNMISNLINAMTVLKANMRILLAFIDNSERQEHIAVIKKLLAPFVFLNIPGGTFQKDDIFKKCVESVLSTDPTRVDKFLVINQFLLAMQAVGTMGNSSVFVPLSGLKANTLENTRTLMEKFLSHLTGDTGIFFSDQEHKELKALGVDPPVIAALPKSVPP